MYFKNNDNLSIPKFIFFSEYIWRGTTKQINAGPAKDQPRHPPRQLRVSAVRLKVTKFLCYRYVDSEDSDLNGQMQSLVSVFAWRACHYT